MRRSLYCLTLLLLCRIAFSKTIHVPEDKATIQAGIDSAAIGDSVLVQPGTYLENLNFNGKSIVVGSLFLATGDTSYISQTIIDGNNGTVVTFENGEDSMAVLCGFTLTKTGIYGFPGSGIACRGGAPRLMNLVIQGIMNADWEFAGGGVFCESGASPQLNDVTITGNRSILGGGICCINSDLTLVNVNISDNSAYGLPEDIYVPCGLGGGIYCDSSDVVMNNVLLKNNYARKGGGIRLLDTNLEMEDVVITRNSAVYARGSAGGGIDCQGSDLNLTNVTISYNYGDQGGGIYRYDSDLNFSFENRCNIYWNHAIFGNEIFIADENTVSVVVDTFTVFNPSDNHIDPMDQCTYNILHAKVVPVVADLYVSPLGDDSNSGLTPSEPLQSIRMAIEKVVVDSLNPRMIFLADGQYSASTTNEVFPIKMKNHLTLCGDSVGQVTIDAESNNSVFYFNAVYQAKIRHVTITGGYSHLGGGIYCDRSILNLENIRLWKNRAQWIELPPPYDWGYDGYGSGGGVYSVNSKVYIQNATIDDNDGNGWGGGIYCSNATLDLQNVSVCNNGAQLSGGGVHIDDSSAVRFDDVVISENLLPEYGGGIAYYGDNLILKNVTVSRNQAYEGDGIYQNGGQLFLLNTIVWDNEKEEIHFPIWQNKSSTITVVYSDIEGGLDSLVTSEQDTVYWLEGNIDADPLFVNPDSGDFNLQEGSPCIDAGTPFFVWQGDTILNLSGADYNGDAPDMGAYESDFTSVSQFQKRFTERYILSQNYPNPFNPETLIQYNLPKQGHVKIDIYNLLGQNVITLADENKAAGSYTVRWKGLDRFGNRLPSGTYFLRMDCGEFFQVRKIVLMK